MNSEKWINDRLASLREKHQHRTLVTAVAAGGKFREGNRDILNFSSNDYLNLLGRDELKIAAIEAIKRCGSGSGASRLVNGSLPIHEELESAIARHKGYPAALFFGSGFMTNAGVVSSLVGRGDFVIADRLIHASLIDAIKLSGAKLVRFQHNDMSDMANCLKKINRGKGRILAVTESVFSMDGDLAPLEDFTAIATRANAMIMVDEAHATGVFGKYGEGLVAKHGLQSKIHITMSTMSKALGGYGGSVACSNIMKEWLINNARSFIYTTAPPPAQCGAALAALRLLRDEPGLGKEVLHRANFFRACLKKQGYPESGSNSQIIPVIIGSNEAALRISCRLREQGVLVCAIRPPTVPIGTARLRFSITLAHNAQDLEQAAAALFTCVKAEGLKP